MRTKTPFLLPFFISFVISACGSDDGSANPSGTDGQDLSSVAEPMSSAEGLSQESSPSVTSSSSVSGSVPAKVEVNVVTEPVATGSAYVCTTQPMTIGSGVSVTCDGTFAGSISDKEDAAPYDPAAVYTDFVDIRKVYEARQPGEKLVLLIRHADRTKSTDKSGILTGLGELQSKSVGEKIAAGEEPLYFHSEIPRTLQTCQKIAEGRGQNEIKHVELAELNGDWFVSDAEKYAAYSESEITSYYLISGWAYEGKYADAHYDLATRGKQFVDEVVLAKMAANADVVVAVSHDQMLVPLLVYLTNAQIELNYNVAQDWINFLAGVAFVIKADGTVRYVPVKGLDSGRQ